MTTHTHTTPRAKEIASATSLLDGFDGVTAADLVRPYAEWVSGLDGLVQMGDWGSVEFAQEIDKSIRERSVRVSTMLDRAGDLVAAITLSTICEPYNVAPAAAARLVFEAVTGSAGLRLTLAPRSDMWGL